MPTFAYKDIVLRKTDKQKQYSGSLEAKLFSMDRLKPNKLVKEEVISVHSQYFISFP